MCRQALPGAPRWSLGALRPPSPTRPSGDVLHMLQRRHGLHSKSSSNASAVARTGFCACPPLARLCAVTLCHSSWNDPEPQPSWRLGPNSHFVTASLVFPGRRGHHAFSMSIARPPHGDARRAELTDPFSFSVEWSSEGHRSWEQRTKVRLTPLPATLQLCDL